jgi:hypothetical protein
LHMRAAGTADAAGYAAVAKFCFEKLELLLHTYSRRGEVD